jgi:hypothetical protein
MKRCSFWATIAFVSAVRGAAFAGAPDIDETTSDESEEAAPVDLQRELSIHGVLGATYFVADPLDGGGRGEALGGVEIAYRRGYLVGAAFMQMGALDPVFFSGGVAAGLALHATPGPRVDVLIAGGFDDYLEWGGGLLSDDPGVDKVLPFVGPRVRMAQTFGTRRGHFEIGLLLGWETNTSRPDARYTYTEHNWLGCWDSCGPPVTHEAHHIVGGSRTIAALTLGGSIDGI